MPHQKHIVAGDIKPKDLFMLAGTLMYVMRIYEVDDPDYVKFQFAPTGSRLLSTMIVPRSQLFILW